MIKKIKNQLWYFENSSVLENKYFKYSFLVNKLLYKGKSKYQKIEIFDNKFYGRFLALDNIIQLSTNFEHIYHELMVHPTMLYHDNPKKILIIGGGDGFALREILKYEVEKIYLVDIDKKIVELSKKYFSKFNNNSLFNNKVNILNIDAFEFLKNNQINFDIIFNDLTDPTPVAKTCWNKIFYNLLSKNIKDNGIIVFQSGGIYYQYGKKVRKDLKNFFKFYKIIQYTSLCYPEDIYTFFYGSNYLNLDSIKLQKIINKFNKLKIQTKYYKPEMEKFLFLEE